MKNALRYLESNDPEKWTGQGESLLQLGGDQGSILLDERPNVDPRRRYKMVAFPDRPLIGAGVYFSPDGKKWTAYDGNPKSPITSSRQSFTSRPRGPNERETRRSREGAGSVNLRSGLLCSVRNDVGAIV